MVKKQVKQKRDRRFFGFVSVDYTSLQGIGIDPLFASGTPSHCQHATRVVLTCDDISRIAMKIYDVESLG